MKFLDSVDAISVVDKGVRNTWKIHWLDELCDNGKPFSTWCKKVDIAGQCYCTMCSKLIVYGSSGKKALKYHAHQPDHIARSISLASNSKLNAPNCVNSVKVTKSVQDSVSEVKSRLGLFLSEHCLPFTLGPELLNLCKQLGKEKVGLESATLSATSATYVTTHGVAEDIKKSINTNLNDTYLSLNLDEATMASGDKVLNILAQYFDVTQGKCIIDVIGCKEINEAPAERVLEILEGVLTERNVKWEQIVSVLMDNCSVMRGRKEGVEARVRRKNEFLLDIDGDTVHKINNAAQKLFSSIENFHSVQCLASDIYSDIENSPKQRGYFKEIQAILGMKKKMLLRPISTRFLQFKTVSERITELWDPLRLYYAAYLASAEKKTVDLLIRDIVQKYVLGSEQEQRLSTLITKIAKQSISDAGKLRKDKIVHGLFDVELKSLLCFQLYTGLLGKFESYVKSFQSKKPLAHRLHTEIFDIVKTFFSNFIKPEAIPSSTPSKLKDLNFKDPSIQLKDHRLCVGDVAYSTLMRVMKDKSRNPWIKSFFSALREGYIQASSMLLKLPINNPILSKLAFISPSYQVSSCTAPAILELAKKLPNVVPDSELGKLDSELRRYVCDNEVTMINCGSDDDEDFRIDSKFWNVVFNLKCSSGPRYPILSRLIKALLSIFSGPIVEGSFNVLNDIIEEDRSRLTNHNFESLLIIKSYLNAREMLSTSMEIPHSMVKAVSSSYSKYQQFLNKPSVPCPPTSDNAVAHTPSSSTTTTLVQHDNSCRPSTSTAANTTTPTSSATPSASSTSNSLTSPAAQSQTSGVKRKQTSLVGFFSKKQRTS